ncbi:MAG: TatD family hydrolase [Gammaproteobacteria bacterium]|nr:TatD family hydrolase [Gammaproteobacteria bacterium]
MVRGLDRRGYNAPGTYHNPVNILSFALIDIGSNLTHESFASDLDAVIARASAAGVVQQVVTGADLAGSRRAALLAALHPRTLFGTAGVHPHHAAGFAACRTEDFLELLARPEVVAVGECGLDYHRDLSPRTAQRTAFVAQLELAVLTRKPVFLHQRDAHEDFSAILADYAPRLAGGVAHCFTGGPPELERYLALGLAIGVTGWVCDERRGAALREAVPLIPADRLMLETDAPYLLPRDLAAKPASRRNEPAMLVHIARVVAAMRAQSPEELAAATTRNARRLFGFSAKDS